MYKFLIVVLSVLLSSVCVAEVKFVETTPDVTLNQLRKSGRVLVWMPKEKSALVKNPSQVSGVVNITTKPVETPTTRASRVWNAFVVKQTAPPVALPIPANVLGKDCLVAERNENPPMVAGSRGNYKNSVYALGVCVVTAFLTESSGVQEPSTEDWTSEEEDRVSAEILDGLSWWASQGDVFNANLSFILEWYYKEQTKYEPIRTNQAFPNGNAAPYEIMERYGYAGSTSGGNAFNSAQREKYNADMAFSIFVADSSNDSDGEFADGYIAYAYLGGPWIVQNYKNNGWGIGRMNQVTAHEIGHVFFALDRYAAANVPPGTRSGYLYIPTPGNSGGCLMGDNTLLLSPSTIGMVGWRIPGNQYHPTPDCLRYDQGGVVKYDQVRVSGGVLTNDSYVRHTNVATSTEAVDCLALSSSPVNSQLALRSSEGWVYNAETQPPVIADVVIDDGTPGYSEDGTGWKDGTWAGGYSGDYRFRRANEGKGTATWRSGLPPGSYEVLVTYVPGHTRTSKAPFMVLGVPSPVTIEVNQKLSPSGVYGHGTGWVSLGVHAFTEEPMVRLLWSSDGTGISDAAWFRTQ